MTNNFSFDPGFFTITGRYARKKMTGRYAFHVHDWKECEGEHTGRRDRDIGPQRYICTKYETTDEIELPSGFVMDMRPLTVLRQGVPFKTNNLTDLTDKSPVVE